MQCQYSGCSRPVYPGGSYCSKTHRDAGNAQAGGITCHYPGCTKPAFPGGNFCSKGHRDNAPSTPATPGGKTCRSPGCTKAVFPGSDFCSKSHRDNTPFASANPGGKTCRHSGCTKSVFPGSDFCSKSHRDAAGPGTSSTQSELHEISSTDSKYADIKNQFDQKWLHAKGSPNVQRIYKITPPSNLVAAYTKYREQVENRGSFMSRGLSSGNECRRFHGTNRACNLGDNGNTQLCSKTNCSLCSIIKESYRLNLAGTNKPFMLGGGGRLGNGLYTSATSSKSNDYSKNAGITSPYKAMLLNKVVVGNTKKLYRDDPSLTKPPPGFDSVVGEPASANQNSTLNYDELVVYSQSAIIPAYLIIYRA